MPISPNVVTTTHVSERVNQCFDPDGFGWAVASTDLFVLGSFVARILSAVKEIDAELKFRCG